MKYIFLLAHHFITIKNFFFTLSFHFFFSFSFSFSLIFSCCCVVFMYNLLRWRKFLHVQTPPRRSLNLYKKSKPWTWGTVSYTVYDVKSKMYRNNTSNNNKKFKLKFSFFFLLFFELISICLDMHTHATRFVIISRWYLHTDAHTHTHTFNLIFFTFLLLFLINDPTSVLDRYGL